MDVGLSKVGNDKIVSENREMSCFEVAEAVGVREALSWLKELGVDRVEVKTDTQLVICAIHGTSTNSSFCLIM